MGDANGKWHATQPCMRFAESLSEYQDQDCKGWQNASRYQPRCATGVSASVYIIFYLNKSHWHVA
jgi:hypothetical protein